MYKYFLLILVTTLSLSSAQRYQLFRPSQRPLYTLCTYTDVSFEKCLSTVQAAQNGTVNLPLQCIRNAALASCIRSVRVRIADMLIISEHDYNAARKQGLGPIIFGRRSNQSLYIAVVPKNISFVDIYNAPISVDLTDHRATHAAIYFNLMRGHAICPNISNVQSGPTIQIVDSANYTLTEDEILICPNRFYNTGNNTEKCNFEASLQTAVFANNRFQKYAVRDIKRIFDTILENFGANQTKNFNFFTTFNARDNIIFENDVIAFDLQPTIRNGVTERVFNYLHCNNDNHDHDERQLQ